MSDLPPSPKGFTRDLDKCCPPEQTVARAKAAFARFGRGILAETRRIDTGRLGIPVFLCAAGPGAQAVMPSRKQMGKGASPAQAHASALMELAERYSFFAFFNAPDRFVTATWSQAEALFGPRLLPLAHMRQSVGETLDDATARDILDLTPWRFAWARDVARGENMAVPADWFKLLNEYNGASAGNSPVEATLQGACELIERHVCAGIDRTRPTLPTIDPTRCADPVFHELMSAFTRQGIRVWLKDLSCGLPAPTVGVLAYDPATFPERSEIVFTAGTATSPAKAAIRALTEVAQLAGDFETGSRYEPSGLPKWGRLDDAAWLLCGPSRTLAELPCPAANDMGHELTLLARELLAQGFTLYSLDTTHPELDLPTQYAFVPGFSFRERTPQASLALFTGRVLAEQAAPETARAGLARLAALCPKAPFLPFYRGLLALRLGDTDGAILLFSQAEPLQKRAEDQALAAFYQAYALTRQDAWTAAEPHLDRALDLCPDVKEYSNLRGVARFKAGRYAEAAADFQTSLALDPGSAMDLANLGLCQLRLGERQPAARSLRAALSLDPELDFARDHLNRLTETDKDQPAQTEKPERNRAKT